MIPYIIPLILTSIGCIRYDVNQKKDVGDMCLKIFLLIYFILLIGLRYKVGGDTINYMGDYDWRVSLKYWSFNFLDKFQPGYTFLCAIGKSISNEFYVFQLIHAFILNGFLAYWIYKKSKFVYSAFLALFLTCYLYFSTEILRESLAVIVFLYNYDNLLKKRWMKYYFGVFVSCCFHISAVFLVVLPFLRWVEFNRTYILVLLIAVVSSSMLTRIFEMFSNISLLADKIDSYKDITSTGKLAGLYRLLVYTIFPTFYCYLTKYGMNRYVRFENPVAIMGAIGTMALFSPIIFGRFLNYFIVFYCVSISSGVIEFIKSRSKVLKHNAIIISISFCLIYGTGFLMYKKYTLWIPYHSIYNPVNVSREYANKMLLNR